MSDEPRAQRTGQPLANEEQPAERFNVDVLGRTIGTADSWDDHGDECYTASNFVPSPGVDLAETSCLGIDYDKGQFLYWNNNGDIVDTRDIIPIVQRLPRSA